MDGVSGQVEYATSSYNINIFPAHDNLVRLRIEKSNSAEWSNAVNNTPISAWLSLAFTVVDRPLTMLSSGE